MTETLGVAENPKGLLGWRGRGWWSDVYTTRDFGALTEFPMVWYNVHAHYGGGLQ